MFPLTWTSLSAVVVASNKSSAPKATPTVDPGYGLWKATINKTAHCYNFRNIQYAQPPVGDLQWAPPQPPLVNLTVVNDSQTGVVCPQGTARWEIESILFVNAYVFGKGSVTAFADDSPPGINESSPFPALDPCTSDDYLFLDVIVPINVYNEAFQDTLGEAPVVVWIYRGGFFTKPKESQSNPAGLEANLN